MPHSPIEALPTELLRNIFQQISQDEETQRQKTSIKNIRLVSRHFREISSALLIRHTVVSLSSQSLLHLEELCRHRHFHKSITTVTIDASYYDVKLAQDRSLYVTDCAARLNLALDQAEHYGLYGLSIDVDEETALRQREARIQKFNEADKIPKELHEFSHDGEEAAFTTDSLQTILRMHEDYVARTRDQEDIRVDNSHIRRLCACLSQLSSLEQLDVSDQHPQFNSAWDRVCSYLAQNNDAATPMQDPNFFSFAFEKSPWNGTFRTAHVTEPPIEMLGELLSELGKAKVRPRGININMNVPTDLRRLHISKEQFRGIGDLVSHASALTLDFQPWARISTLDDADDSRSSEMPALASVTKALASTSTLQTLNVNFHNRPIDSSGAILSDILPIQSVTWPELERLELHHIAFDIDDLKTFVHTHKDSLRSFGWISMFLSNGKWEDVLDVLRRCSKLESVEIDKPSGGGWYSGYSGYAPGCRAFPLEKAEEYVRGITSVNPLRPRSPAL